MHPDICGWPNKQFYGNEISGGNQRFSVFSLHPYTVFNIRGCGEEAVCAKKLMEALMTNLKADKLTCGVITSRDIENLLETEPW